MERSLADLLRDAAADIDAVEVRPAGAGLEFVVAGRVIATAEGGAAEFRLDPAVAQAALHTPDSRPSDRSPERIAFEPRELDRYARDRAVAWLGSSVRRASKKGDA